MTTISKLSQLSVALVILTLLLVTLAVSVQSSEAASPTRLESFFYTQDEATLFSYYDNTYFVVKDSSGGISWNGTLNEGESKQLTLGDGIYSATASKPYAVIVGAPETQNVVGYYAMDTLGKGTSTDVYTYIPPPNPLYPGSRFIIFAYTDATVVTVTDAFSKTILWQGTLNKSEHFSQDLSNATWQNKTVHVESTFSVSALCYLDQGFIVPSSTGLFTGTLVYTFAGNITNGNNDLNVIGYHDNTWVTISNSTSKSLVWNGTLNAGEAHSEVFSKPTYLTIESNQSVAVTVDPYPSWIEGYQAGLYATDIDGNLIGTQFYATARGEGPFKMPGYLRILAYQNNTHVTVTDEATRILVWNGTLNEMQLHMNITSHTVYNVTSDKPVSVLEGYGEWSAMFAPLYFTTDTEPPTIGAPSRTPQNPTPTQEVQISANVSDDLSGVQKVILSYSNDTTWTNLTMTQSGENTYEAAIPAMPSQTLVNYRIVAYDNVNNAAIGDNLSYAVASYPTGSITINGGEAYTTSPSVTLTLTYSDASTAVSQVRYSNDGAWDAEQWENPSPSKAWSLSQGDGTKTVYYQVSNIVGMISPTYSDSIILDTTAPMANAGQSQTVTQGASVTFNAGGSIDANGIVSYLWDFKDGSSGSGIITTHTYSSAGTYLAKLTVQDPAGNTATATVTIVVQAPQPTPSPSPSPSPTPSPSPAPNPSPSPSPSPSQSPSPTPRLTPTPTPSEERPLFVYVLAVAVAFLIIGAAAFMIKKRR